ncbi:lactococcin 972 family bacteriocin [Bacillus arachidis]|uniref:lactococcin 972 family bacteriocin n=1 Tax=Bacillus arachidis TaxID=2819290 RepID=UPI00255C99A7|nr:lactococcin 972 family bacteriocin [Bacillus arachidis]WIY58771.1 lactococcin 972 family bacteriocin [Bacillus arachidis]
MKKKAITFALSSMLAVGALVPITASAGSVDSWSYGFDKNKMKDYSIYNHQLARHSAGITKNGKTFKSEIAPRGVKAGIFLDYTGPYRVNYHKYTN